MLSICPCLACHIYGTTYSFGVLPNCYFFSCIFDNNKNITTAIKLPCLLCQRRSVVFCADTEDKSISVRRVDGSIMLFQEEGGHSALVGLGFEVPGRGRSLCPSGTRVRSASNITRKLR